uniref:Phosphatidate cytidylyltransferase n=1 Tax=Vitrella brassicaformis TaxID=1169539 RepID=A0A7S1JT36_9ALVE|mmetsp:Transcript_23458/g.57938  ORF Transcript_23458/g.57938 Transcript_23458/m.57938 type:complete len:199 (+) Transcript_23458:152-748(+)
MVLPGYLMMTGVISVFIVCQFFDVIPVFYARKLVHMLSGWLLLNSPYTAVTRPFMVVFAIYVVSHIWMADTYKQLFGLPPYRFARRGDLGITIYGLIVMTWAILELPFALLMPMFFADPLAAIVGKAVRSPKWAGDKTIAGSLTVFFVTLLTTPFLPSIWLRLAISCLTSVLEAYGGVLDNLLVSMPPVVAFLVSSVL